MMTARQSAIRTPVSLLWPPADGAGAILRAALLMLLGSLFLTASAKVQVPFWPVPMTLQSAALMLLGIAYGWRLAGATVLLYLAEGAMGLPVFAGTPALGLGLPYMLGPTGGYLLAFLPAAMLCGLAAERGRRVSELGIAILAATALIYLLGVAWLAGFVGFERALALGVAPFLLGDLLKAAVVFGLALAGLSRLRRAV
jgi:biotin transport system substrate-specific component